MSRAHQLQYDLEHINFSNMSQLKIDDEPIYNFIKSLYHERSLKELSDSFVGSSVQMPPPDVVIALPPGVVRPSPPVVVPFVIPLVVFVTLPCGPSPPNAFRAISKNIRAPWLSPTCNAIHASSIWSLTFDVD